MLKPLVANTARLFLRALHTHAQGFPQPAGMRRCACACFADSGWRVVSYAEAETLVTRPPAALIALQFAVIEPHASRQVVYVTQLHDESGRAETSISSFQATRCARALHPRARRS